MRTIFPDDAEERLKVEFFATRAAGWWSLARKYYFALSIRRARELKRRLRDRLRLGRTRIGGPSIG